MKIGSLVEYLGGQITPADAEKIAKGVKLPETKVIYTVRSIFTWGNIKWIRLEEIVNPVLPGCSDLGYNIVYFREVQPPMDLSFIETLQQPQHA